MIPLINDIWGLTPQKTQEYSQVKRVSASWFFVLFVFASPRRKFKGSLM